MNLAIKILKIPLNLARRLGLIASNPAEAIEMLSADTVEKAVFSRRPPSRRPSPSTDLR